MDTEGIVFDLDGVLVDSWENMRYALSQAWNALRLPGTPPEAAFRRELGRPLAEIASRLGIPEAFVPLYEAASASAVRLVVAYPSALESLSALRRLGFRLAVNTSKSRRRTSAVLELLCLQSSFDVVITGSDVERGKPAPDSLLAIGLSMRLSPEQLAFVGDSPSDIACARAAGVRSIAARWGYSTDDDLLSEHPDALIDSLSDLPDTLQRWARGCVQRQEPNAWTNKGTSP